MTATALPGVPQGAAASRRIGLALAMMAVAMLVCVWTDASNNPDIYTLFLIATLALAFAGVCRMTGRLASLIGILFISHVLFVLPRPVFALLARDDSVYSLSFGLTVEPAAGELCRVLAFWTIGIASFFAGYFLRFQPTTVAIRELKKWELQYLETSFAAASLIVIVLLPMLAFNRLRAYAMGGYASLYLAQASYSFDITRAVDYLCPLVYALAVLIRKRTQRRVMIACLICYAATGLLAGRRMDAGSWLLVALWHYSVIEGKRLGIGRIAVILCGCAFAFQTIDFMRGGDRGSGFLLLQFFIGQGITFLLPALSWQIPAPSLHTVVGSLVPMGGVYHVLGIGSAATSNLGSYVCSQAAPSLFESGLGLGSSVYLELFYMCGGIFGVYACACLLIGMLLHEWEKRAMHDPVALLMLCASVASFASLARGSSTTVSSDVLYASVFMGLMFGVFMFVRILQGALLLRGEAHAAD